MHEYLTQDSQDSSVQFYKFLPVALILSCVTSLVVVYDFKNILGYRAGGLLSESDTFACVVIWTSMRVWSMWRPIRGH